MSGIISARHVGHSLLSRAVESKSVDLFEAVVNLVRDVLDHQRDNIDHRELVELLESRGGKEPLLSAIQETEEHRKLSEALLSASRAIQDQDFGLLKAVIKCVMQPFGTARTNSSGFELDDDQVCALIGRTGSASPLERLLFHQTKPLMKDVIRCARLESQVARVEEVKHLNKVFLERCIAEHFGNSDRPTEPGVDHVLEGLEGKLDCYASLLTSSAQSSKDHLVRLAKHCPSVDTFKKFCLKAVAAAPNPFELGADLSLALNTAAEEDPEGRRIIVEAQQTVDALLLEIFERLPSTVQGMGGIRDTSVVLEGDTAGLPSDVVGFGKPLGTWLTKRKFRRTFCGVPLVMDFLSRRFTAGLPSLRGTAGASNELEELDWLQQHGLVMGDGKEELSNANWKKDFWAYPRVLLQGAHLGIRGHTFLPGAQFIAAGVVAKPHSYYKVPAMRMVLDFLVYVGMIVTLSGLVLFSEEDAFSWSTEGAFAATFVLTGLYREMCEMRRSLDKYSGDQWNILDVLGLACLLIGLLFRWSNVNDDYLFLGGTVYYALSAPLLVSRTLFFAQILPFQGPMIQVIFSMAAVFFKFSFVIGIVILGFTMSFHTLFRRCDGVWTGEDPNCGQGRRSFGETMLELFRAALGEVELFDKYDGSPYERTAKIILVAYLLIATILLLNLLVAILGFSHAQVQENVDREFWVAKAEIIDHYELVVKRDLLPAPFNLVAVALSPCFMLGRCSRWGAAHNEARNVVGRVIFWLIMCPTTVVGGTLLWICSTPSALYRQRMQLARPEGPKGGWANGRYPLVALLCLVAAPVCLLFVAIRSLAVGLVDKITGTCDVPNKGGVGKNRIHRPNEGPVTVERLLLRDGRGLRVKGLCRFLDNPIIDKDIREDEKTHKATVEHIKLLRNRLEGSLVTSPRFEKKFDELLAVVNRRFEAVLGAVEERADINRRLDDICSAVEEIRRNQVVAQGGQRE